MVRRERERENLLSIIIPSFNEEGNIENTADTVLKIMEAGQISSELIFVSDGSNDGTFQKIAELSKTDSRIRGIEFSRNFGKEAAILAGIEKGKGDCYVVMDCDLQHPPETIIEMYHMWEEGYDIVEGIKSSRGNESKLHRLMASSFYVALSKFTGIDMMNSSDFKLFDKKVAKILLSMPERRTFFRALTFWTGYKRGEVYYEVVERKNGTSKWSLGSLIKYAVRNIVSFSTVPLDMVTLLGIISVLCMIVLGIQTLVRYLMGDAIEGFTTVILLLLLLCGGILIGLGIIGKYIAAIYEEIKQRPRYLIWHDTDSMDDVEVKK